MIGVVSRIPASEAMWRLAIVLSKLVVLIATAESVEANTRDYQLDFQAVSEPSGHQLKVSGTVTFDFDFRGITGLSLNLYHESDPGVPIYLTNPLYTLSDATHWEASADTLTLVVDQPNRDFRLQIADGPTGGFAPEDRAVFALTPYGFEMYFGRYDRIADDYDGAVEFRNRIQSELIGVALPEPSTLALAALGALGLLITARRWRHMNPR